MSEDLPGILEKFQARNHETPEMKFFDSRTKKVYPMTAKGYMNVMSWYCPQAARENPETLSLCEIPNEKAPITICYKFRLKNPDEIDLGDELIKSLVFTARTVVRSMVKENSHCDMLCCLVTEVDARVISEQSDTPQSGETTCVDIRLQFPNAIFSTGYQTKKLMDRLKAANLNLSKDYGITTSDIVNRALDESYVTKPIPLVGSTDIPGDIGYKPPIVYQTPLIDNFANLTFSEWQDSLVPSESYMFCGSGYDHELINSEEPEVWAPLITSLFYSANNATNPHSEQSDSNSTSNSELKPLKKSIYSATNFARDQLLAEEDPLELAKKFITTMWKPSRLVDPFDSKVAGEALYNASHGSEYGLSIWIDVTNRACKKLDCALPKPFCDDTIENICENEWYSFKFENNTLVNLGYIARDDNPDAYHAWHQSWYKPAMELAVSGLDYDISVAFHRYYWLEFMSTIVGRNTIVWYRFEMNRLRETPSGRDLRVLLSSDFAEAFRRMLSDISSGNLGPKSQHSKEITDDLVANISNLITSLKIRRVKNNIMAELADQFLVRDLNAKLDTNPDLLGAPNGIFVCTDYSISFRPGRPQDYITRSIGCRFNEKFTWDHPQVKKVVKWIRRVHCHDEETYDYFWMHQAALMRGVNRNKKIFCYQGEKANNSKSSIERVIECAFGDYCDKMPAAKLNSSFENAEGASPVLAALTATRVIFIDEPDRSKPLRTDTLKMMTSDSFRSRKLHENGGKNRPLFTIIIVCNFAPEHTEKSKGIRSRWTIMNFEAVWDANPPESKDERIKQNIYKLDINFDDKAPKFAPVWIWIASQYYEKAARIGLRNLPKRVQAATDLYWEEKDNYFLYLRECIDDKVDEKGVPVPETMTLTFTELYEHFIGWFRSHAPSKRIPDQIEFSCEIYQRWGRPVAGVWKGKKIKLSAMPKSTGMSFGDEHFGGIGMGMPQPQQQVNYNGIDMTGFTGFGGDGFFNQTPSLANQFMQFSGVASC